MAAVKVTITPERLPIVDPTTGLPTIAFYRAWEALWKRTGGFGDDVFAGLFLGSVGDATLAEVASSSEVNSQAIESLKALIDTGRALELEEEINALRAQVESLKGQVDTAVGSDAQVAALEVSNQREAVSSGNLANEIQQVLLDLQGQIDAANSSIASLRGDTSGLEAFINGQVIVAKAATLDPGRNINGTLFDGTADINIAITPAMLSTGGPSWDGSGNLTAVTYKVGALQVVSARKTGWTAATGTANKGAYASYAGQTVSAAYVQAEAQQTDDALKALSRRFYSLETDLTSHGLIGA